MNHKGIEKTFEFGCLIDSMQSLLIESADALLHSDIEASVVTRYEPQSGIENPWWGRIYEGWVAVALTYWKSPDLRCVLSREGDVRLYGPGGKPDHTYQIPEAGVFGEAATGLGYVNRIRAIGDHLYVCGQSRQVYRFEFDGKDLSTGRWLNVAGAMRQAPMPEPPDAEDEEAFDLWLDENDAIDLVDMDGPSEHDIYAVGDEAWHWNGRAWSQLALPTDEALSAIKVISAHEIVLVGHNGTVLVGCAQNGFQDISRIEDNQNFVGVELFHGQLYLASNLGLFVYDPATCTIERYVTNLKPDLQDTHMLEAKDGILWSFGFKDLAWFDGTCWTRVDHPDNPPIR